MDITWSAIGKLMFGAFATYILLPAALIARDYVIWKLISLYILNDKLRTEIKRYAILADNWNRNFAGKKNFDLNEEGEEFMGHLEKSQKLSDEINQVKFFIDRKSRFLTWLLKHYKQDISNPIPDWKAQAKEEVEQLNERS